MVFQNATKCVTGVKVRNPSKSRNFHEIVINTYFDNNEMHVYVFSSRNVIITMLRMSQVYTSFIYRRLVSSVIVSSAWELPKTDSLTNGADVDGGGAGIRHATR